MPLVIQKIGNMRRDKILHFLVCFLAAIISPMFSLGLALGKEYGDSKASGNHWCWWDIISDTTGIVIGTVIRILIIGRWNWI